LAEGAFIIKDPVKTPDILKRYKESGDPDLRNDLVIRYSYIAKTVAQQMRGIASNYADVEDIVNQGVLTLIDCIERFEPDKEVKFESYAFMRIRGAIIDFIRKQDWRPRRVRKTAKEVAAAYDELSNTLLREPTDKEISSFLNISEDELQKHYSEFSRAMVVSFESMLENASQTDILPDLSDGMDQPEQTLFKQELKEQLVMAIDELTEREKLVISLYYYENLKLAEISKVLGVSESRVCQIHSKALGKLKDKMDCYVKG
jgi:RNA polymerase sigma factor for flagellar operon FliA